MATALAERADPVLLSCPGPDRQRRWTVLIRFLLLLPHLFVLMVLGVAAFVVSVIGWFGALFSGRLPVWAFDFLAGYMRWTARVDGYLYLLTEVYPPFTMRDVEHPVRLAVPAPTALNRAAVLFRIPLAIPVSLLAELVGIGANVLMIVFWVIALVRGRLPRPVHQALLAFLRYQIRIGAYVDLLTPLYPGGLFGDGEEPAIAYRTVAPVAPEWPGPAPVEPAIFTHVGWTYGWGYSADRRFCGAWLRSDPRRGLVWPLEQQSAAWQWFWQVEPAAVERAEVPAIVPAGQPGGVPSGWSLVLSKGAKRLLALFIALGAIYWFVPPIVLSSPQVNLALARQDVTAAWQTLAGEMRQYEQVESGCATATSRLACVTGGDRSAAADFATFHRDVAAIDLPSQAQQAAANLESETTRVQRAFSWLASSATERQYLARSRSSGLDNLLRQTDADFQTLLVLLGGQASGTAAA